MVEAGKSSKASAKIIELTNLVLGSVSGGEDPDTAGDKKSFMDKFGDFKSFLPSKKAKEDVPKV
jgi:pilus assembly protein CpaE